ncbi:hypothetical protein pmac_cds_866 [Pandoravirus macleodensis]|uniref:Uncharacterized protein n=1 Tax=Pandoravirus macleodensis TaxID=2107707 RepID=A0A2U7UGF7_9VIRU|nr:hypothetical protein pmac_cds_866 [Pandoravirus macleodensis]AVK77554.1 hypothetical protein pmac_cds_866 [Pandoravirus macleodensis]
MQTQMGATAGVIGVVQSAAGDVYSAWAGVAPDMAVCPPAFSDNTPPAIYNDTAQHEYTATFPISPSWPIYTTFFAVACVSARSANSQCYFNVGAQVLQSS